MSNLREIGNPVIGSGLEHGFQSTGANNRVITRRYTMRIAEEGEHIVNLINPTLRDPQYPDAVIVKQAVSANGSPVDCTLTRVFAEVPSEWNDYDDRVMTFPGVIRPAMGGEEMNWRNSPVSLQAIVRVNRKYYLSNPQRIPRVAQFTPSDGNGIRVSTLTSSTVPDNEEYAAMVAAGMELCMGSRIFRWMGDIWCRETYYAPAQ